MSRAHGEAVVRQPIAVAAHSRRRVEERLGLRFPRALAFVAQMVLRLPQRSRLRQALVRRAVRLSFEATNRGDYEAVFMLYHPEVEMREAKEKLDSERSEQQQADSDTSAPLELDPERFVTRPYGRRAWFSPLAIGLTR